MNLQNHKNPGQNSKLLDMARELRTEVNRFFGMKIAGACGNCGGENCAECKGRKSPEKPSVSLWDASQPKKSEEMPVQKEDKATKQEEAVLQQPFAVFPKISLEPNDNRYVRIIDIHYTSKTKPDGVKQKLDPSVVYLADRNLDIKTEVVSPAIQSVHMNQPVAVPDAIKSSKIKHRTSVQSQAINDVHGHIISFSESPKRQFVSTEQTSLVSSRTQVIIPIKRTVVQSGAKSKTSEKATKEEGVINGYTYMEILTTPWLRKLYGHLIGIYGSGEPTHTKSEIKKMRIVTVKSVTLQIRSRSHNAAKPEEKQKTNVIERVETNEIVNKMRKAIAGLKLVKSTKPATGELKMQEFKKKLRAKISVLQQNVKELTVKVKLLDLQKQFRPKTIDKQVRELHQTFIKIEKLLIGKLKLLKKAYKTGKNRELLAVKIKSVERIIKLVKLMRNKKIIVDIILNNKKKKRSVGSILFKLLKLILSI